MKADWTEFGRLTRRSDPTVEATPFPNGDRKLRRGLQILDERLVTRLNDADLWKLLDPDLARLLQVISVSPGDPTPPSCNRRRRG